MKQRSRFFVANIVLAVVFAIFLVISLIVVLVGNVAFRQFGVGYSDFFLEDVSGAEYDVSAYERDVYELPEIVEASAQLLGPEYQGKQAEEGYQFYSVKALIQNTGTKYLISEYLGLYCEGAEYDDVRTEYSYDETEDPFSYINMEIIPSCQMGEVEVIAQVKDGIQNFSLVLCRDYDNEEYQKVEVTLH